MNKELAIRTIGYLIGHYKTHNETIINEQEIEAIEFMLKINEDLEQQCKKQKEVINKINEFIKELYDNTDDTTCYDIDKNIKEELLDILKEVSE